MTFAEKFNLIPPCLRNADGGVTVKFNNCVLGSISYYIEILFILVGIVAFFYIIFAGIQMATAFGNESKYASAKNTLLHAVIGVIVATMAYSIVSFVTSIFDVEAPKVYNTEGTTGEIENNEGFVEAVVAFREGPNPGNGVLTPEELEDAENGSSSNSLVVGGTAVAMYMMNDSDFRAVLVTKTGGPERLSVQQLPAPDGRYYVRAWGQTKDFKGATLEIYQIDPKTNFEHKKVVTIN